MTVLTDEQRSAFRKDGFVVLRGACIENLPELRRQADALMTPGAGSVDRFGRGQRRVLTKAPQAAVRSPEFRALAQSPKIAGAVEDLVGRARLFRDVIVTKPPRDGVPVRFHQDIAFWDVSPASEVLSAWIALDEAPRESGCLEVVPGSQHEILEHGLAAGPIPLPRRVSRALRAATSLTGTGDNPTTRSQRLFARVKNLVLGNLSRRIPALGDLVDLHIDNRRVPAHSVRDVPIAAGDAILFDSRLIHGSGPNSSPNIRRAYIASYMSEQCTVPGRTMDAFLPARAAD